MKKIIFLLGLMTSLAASAQQITGQPVLKGSLRTKLMVKGIETTCLVKVDKVKNLMEEDAFGYPGYQVLVKVELKGSDSQRRVKVAHKAQHWLINMYSEGGQRRVKDYAYFSTDGAKLNIDTEGRLRQFSFPYGQDNITCSF